MKSNLQLLSKSHDVPRCTHLTVHTVLCVFCGMTVCSDCNSKHKSIHYANKDQEIPKSEFEDWFDLDGFDKQGYNKEGYNKEGFDENGFDSNGYNENGFNKEGFDLEGYDENGFDSNGYDKQGYDHLGYDKEGYNQEGYNKFNKKTDEELSD